MAPGNIPCPGCAVAIPFWYNQCPLCGHMLIQAKDAMEPNPTPPPVAPLSVLLPYRTDRPQWGIDDLWRCIEDARIVLSKEIDAARAQDGAQRAMELLRDAESERVKLRAQLADQDKAADAAATLDGLKIRRAEAERDVAQAQLAEAQGELQKTPARRWFNVTEAENRQLKAERDTLTQQLAARTAEVEEFRRIRDSLVKAVVVATGADEKTVREMPLTMATKAHGATAALRLQVAWLREALLSGATERRNGPCWCRTGANLYCVGQPHCEAARAALAQPALAGGTP